jgi:hypothetical protein
VVDRMMGWMVVIVLIGIFSFMSLSLLGSMDKVTELEFLLATERGSLVYMTERVVALEDIVEKDDALLHHFTHGTWDRKCTYDVQAGLLLADGSVKSSVIQFCD